MPCDCSGFAVEISAFGKKYTGYTTREGNTVNYAAIIRDGEHALCRAQQVIRDMKRYIHDDDLVPYQLSSRIEAELKMLKQHEAKEK